MFADNVVYQNPLPESNFRNKPNYEPHFEAS